MKPPFIWDPYSDQPYPLKDKAYKKKMRFKHSFDSIILLILTLLLFPIALLLMWFVKSKKSTAQHFYGMGISLEKGTIQYQLIEELGVKYLLLRMPLWEVERIDEYVTFAKGFGNDKKILLNILQDREHIENSSLLHKDIKLIFDAFGSFVEEYQIGNAINRTKWGFFSMKEYLQWYQQIQGIRDTSYPTLKLIGSSVIDFEYHYTIRTLFHRFPIFYDTFSALLYVDRRGAPSNKQMGIFDTTNKVKLLYTLVKLSNKSNNTLYITEANWPLSNTAPYAPTSEKECVSEKEYNDYMLEYHHMVLQTGLVERIYWHQLIAHGYGLVSDKGGKIRKTEAFNTYKKMCSHTI